MITKLISKLIAAGVVLFSLQISLTQGNSQPIYRWEDIFHPVTANNGMVSSQGAALFPARERRKPNISRNKVPGTASPII